MEELDTVQYVLDLAGEHNLQAEVITFALIAMKNNNKLSVEEALREGLSEWDL